MTDDTKNLIFNDARTHSHWEDSPVSDEIIREIYSLAKWGPTSLNSNPGRFVFITSRTEKERLKPYLFPENVDKTMSAPCCVIVAGDMQFYENLGTLWPLREMRSLFEGNTQLTLDTVRRNAILQGAYLMVAARTLGLDCGPMSGFDANGVNSEFFPDGRWKADFLFNLGYGVKEKLGPRKPRLDFEQACRVI